MQTCETCKHYIKADHMITSKDKLDFARCILFPKVNQDKIDRLSRVGEYKEEVVHEFCVDVRNQDTCETYEVKDE